MDKITSNVSEIIHNPTMSSQITSNIENIIDCNSIDLKNDSQNREFCRTIIKYCNETTLEPSFVLKMVSFIESLFLDSRESFNDRGSFISTALFKKNDFDMENKKTYSEFKDLLFIYENKKNKEETHIILQNNKFKIVSNNITDKNFNVFCIQNLIKILNTPWYQPANDSTKIDSTKTDRIKICENLDKIIKNIPNRSFFSFYKKLFEALIEIDDILNISKFKALSYLINEGIERGTYDILEMSLERFKTTKSDVLRTFFVYSFEILDDIVKNENKLKIHLKFAETVLENEMLNKTEGMSRKVIKDFIEKGMKRYQLNDILD